MYGKAAAEMSQPQLYAYFLTRVRANLHIVLAFSPIGEAFRDRLRKFPSLINCCAIGVCGGVEKLLGLGHSRLFGRGTV